MSSSYLIFASKSKFWGALIPLANVAVLLAVRDHVGKFWKKKAKVPLPKMGEFNEAISVTQEVRLNMMYLILSWGVVGTLALVL